MVSLLAITIMITIVSIMSDGEKTLYTTYEYLCPLLLLLYLDSFCKKRFFGGKDIAITISVIHGKRKTKGMDLF